MLSENREFIFDIVHNEMENCSEQVEESTNTKKKKRKKINYLYFYEENVWSHDIYRGKIVQQNKILANTVKLRIIYSHNIQLVIQNPEIIPKSN